MNQLGTNISGKECGHLSCLQLQQSKQEKAERKDEFDTVFVFNSKALGNFHFVCC